ncbi:putative transcription regulator protein Rhizobium tropici [Rhizobium freirei PRF 81]|uniref:HTH-type transcriptional regulator TtuA n=1 Tax=Rhizobium freirei PRF 81 TaxID=363754 RepID=N6V6W3_9HYPH|nr:LysR family transcriptional regulator [Rhizobium freirei]ENN88916.1 putative transcription regulator protein Rhizobium tropici [Rhizobium freirei PRF 81]
MEYLNDMALFVEVVKARSFRRAAETLGMPNSTLSRRISFLEKSIGLRLLHRTTRRIELTEAGQLYYERSKRIVEEARIAHEQLGEMVARPSGVLRVSLPVDFATTYLAPLLPEFAALYPGMDFDFDLTPRNVDLVAEPFDLAIRMAAPQASNLIARVIARLTPRLYAAPGYLEQNGEPHHPSELKQHQCLTMQNIGSWVLHREAESVETTVGSRFRGNSVAMIRRLAVLEMGISALPERVVMEELASGQLRRILPEWQLAATSVYAVTETRLLPAKTQRFIEFLRERLREV